MPRKLITAIYDNVARAMVGPFQIFPHEAPAIRMFSDVAADNRSLVGQHPGDFDSILMGHLDDESDPPMIEPKAATPIITGAQWLAAQQQKQENGQ